MVKGTFAVSPLLNRTTRLACLAAAATFAVAPAAPASATTIVLTDFQTPQIPPYVGSGFPTNYIYDPTNVPNVTFVGSAGIQGNGSGWVFPNAPEGNQSAFLQAYDYNLDCCKGTSTGSLTVAAPGLVAGQHYDLGWQVVGRPYYGTTSYSITDGGVTIVETLSGPSQAQWATVHHLFVAGGADAFTFSVPLPIGLTVPSGSLYDHSIGIDYITLTTVGAPPVVQQPVGQPQPVGSTNTVPEPAAWALMIAGFGMVGLAARRRRVAVAA